MIYLYRRHKQKKQQREAEAARAATIGAPGETTASGEPEIQNEKGTDISAVQAPTSTEEVEAKQKSEKKKDPRTAQEKHNDRVYRWKLILCLFPPYLLATIDLTIVATALPFIASYFDKLTQLNWIVTSYTLTSTAFIPVFGQLANVFGRHATLQTSMGFMVVGSTLAAAAQTWGMLLLGRALQGVSAAGLMNLIKIILADKVSLEQQSKNTTIFAFISGVSWSIGPVVGGYLTDASWRYCFVLSIPIALISSALLFFVLRKELIQGSSRELDSSGNHKTLTASLAQIDYGGVFLFIFGVGLIILGLSWGGTTYPWKSANVLAPVIIGAVLFILFFIYEHFLEPGRKISQMFPSTVAMIPSSLFQKLDTVCLAAINASSGAAVYSAFYFISIYFTIARGYAASDAGIQLLYYIPGIGVGAYMSMFLCNIWPAQTFWPLFLGSVIEGVGMGLITWAVTTTNTANVNGMMALCGVGTGLRGMPSTLHGVGIWPTRIAAVVSAMDFFFPFGGTIGITIMGAVFNNKFASSTLSILSHSPTTSAHDAHITHVNAHSKGTIRTIDHLPPAVRHQVRDAAKTAVMWAFVSVLPIMLCSITAAIGLGNVWIKKKSQKKEGDRLQESDVVYQPYLFALLTGTVNAKKTSNMADVVESEPGKEPQKIESEAQREEIVEEPKV